MISRRTMLHHAGLAGLGLAITELPALGFPAEWRQAQDQVVPFTDVPDNFVTVNATNKRVAGLDLRELSSYLTPEQNYFVVAHYGVPKVDPATWKLDIRGRVANPRSYTLDELKKRSRAQQECVFECGGNRGRRHHEPHGWQRPLDRHGAVAAHSGRQTARRRARSDHLGRGRGRRRDSQGEVPSVLRPFDDADRHGEIRRHPRLGDERRTVDGGPRISGARRRPGLVRGSKRQVGQRPRSFPRSLHGPLSGTRLRHHHGPSEWRQDGVGRNIGHEDPHQVDDCARHAGRPTDRCRCLALR